MRNQLLALRRYYIEAAQAAESLEIRNELLQEAAKCTQRIDHEI